MDDDERPRRRSAEGDLGAASLLASESLDRFSLDELDERVVLLKSEIVRIESHRGKVSAHMMAAEALFRPKQG